MPIHKRSRYNKSETVPWTRADGSEVELIAPTPRPDRHAVFSKKVTDTDRLDSLATAYYRDPNKLWLIADASPVMDPFDIIDPGAFVNIPPNK